MSAMSFPQVGPACHRERLQKMKSPDKMPETQKFAAPCADQNRETTNKHKQLDSAVASSCFLKCFSIMLFLLEEGLFFMTPVGKTRFLTGKGIFVPRDSLQLAIVG